MPEAYAIMPFVEQVSVDTIRTLGTHVCDGTIASVYKYGVGTPASEVKWALVVLNGHLYEIVARDTPFRISTFWAWFYLDTGNLYQTGNYDYDSGTYDEETGLYYNRGYYFSDNSVTHYIPTYSSVREALDTMATSRSTQTIPVQFVRQGGVLQDTFDITVKGSMA